MAITPFICNYYIILHKIIDVGLNVNNIRFMYYLYLLEKE